VLYSGWLLCPITSCDLADKFWLVPGHAVTSIRIPRFPELRFHTRTWMQSMDTTHLDIIVMSCHFQTSRSWKFSTPDLISCLWSKVLASCFCQLCFPVSPIHVTSHSCVLSRTSDTPNLMLCSLFYNIRLLPMLCIQHVWISTLILVFIVYSTHSMILNSDSVLPE